MYLMVLLDACDARWCFVVCDGMVWCCNGAGREEGSWVVPDGARNGVWKAMGWLGRREDDGRVVEAQTKSGIVIVVFGRGVE